MRFFDKMYIKLFGKKKGGKIRIKLFSFEEEVDEQKQFLLDDDHDSFLTPEKKKTNQKKQTKDISEFLLAADEIKKQNDEKKNAKKKAKTALKEAEKKEKEEKKKKEPKETVITSAKKKDSAKQKLPAKTKEAAEVKEQDETEGSSTVTESRATRNGKFDIRKAKDGRYFFSLYASNYAVIAYSQMYSSSSAAMNGIQSVIANASKTLIEDTTLKRYAPLPCPKWEIYVDKGGEYRFRLYAVNGLCVCHSAHGYSTKSGCKGGIESISRFASDAAKINKKYLK